MYSSEVRLLRLVVFVASTTLTQVAGRYYFISSFLFSFSLMNAGTICCNGVRTILSMMVYEIETSAIVSIRKRDTSF